MKTAPASVRAIVLSAKKAEQEKRAGHIASLKANQAEFNETELAAMSTEQLERFDRAFAAAAGDAAPATDFSARVPQRAASASTSNEPPNGYAIALAKQKGAK